MKVSYPKIPKNKYYEKRLKTLSRGRLAVETAKHGWCTRPIVINGGEAITFAHWEEIRKIKGLRVFAYFCKLDMGSPSQIDGTFTSIRSALKFAKYFDKLLPHGTKFIDTPGWVGFPITFKVENPNFDETTAIEKLYSKLDNAPLPEKYTRLSEDENFNRLVNGLRGIGLYVAVKLTKGTNYSDEAYEYWDAQVDGVIDGGFCTDNSETYTNIQGKFAFDATTHFNKYSQCDYVFDLPKNDDELNEILAVIKNINSQELLDEIAKYGDY